MDAAKTLAYFGEQGVAVKVISGDHQACRGQKTPITPVTCGFARTRRRPAGRQPVLRQPAWDACPPSTTDEI
jgi:hypothetical protein